MTEMSKELYEKLEHTEHGETLKNSPRWSTFMPGWMVVAEWEVVLGDDVNSYRHHEYMADLTKEYLETSERLGKPFSEEDSQALIDVAYIHDFPEAIDGDVPDPEKKFDKKTFEKERQSMIKVLGAVAVDFEAIVIAGKALDIMQGRSLLSLHWRAIELVGYHETCLKAKNQLLNFDELREELYLSPDRWSTLEDGLYQMANDVKPIIENQLREFIFLPPIKEYLDERT